VTAAPEICILWDQLNFPHDTLAQWKSQSLRKVWHECWRTESTCLSATGTMITITNTIIITIITMTIILYPSSLSALDWMCTHTAIICSLQAADFARKYVSQYPIFNFFCWIQNCDCQYHDYEVLWNLIVLATIKIWFTH
jgi:hypothetical protein